MSTPVLIIGPSGSGKSRSLLNLDPETSFLICAMKKPLPFRGWKDKWRHVAKDAPGGNLLYSDDPEEIRQYMHRISDKRSACKTIVIDDAQYIMANEFMRRARERGYEKFTQIGQSFWLLVMESGALRDDLTVVFLQHSDTDDSGSVKAKTIGKMLDDKVTLEGMFTIVLRTAIRDEKHIFTTRNSGNDTVKTPEGMFNTDTIENDISIVLEAITNY